MAGGNDRGKGKGRMSGQQEQEEEQRRRQLREAAERERIEEERQRIEREPIPEDIVNEFYNANMEVPNMEEFERWLDEEEDDDAGRPKRSAGRATGYHVQVQEPSGSVTKKTLTVQDAHNLPSGHRVKVDWSVFTRQPKGKGGQLFGRFCGNVGQNFQRFPIDALDWRKINDEQKNFAWNEIVKRKFEVRDMFKSWAQSKMGDGWKNKRLDMFNKRNQGGSRPMQELIEDVPGGVPADAWETYVRWRRGDIGKKRSQQGVYSRSQQKVHHTAGTKPFSVGYGEMEDEATQQGKKATYGLFFRRFHRHEDGTPTSREAEELIARIEEEEAALEESQGDSVDPTASLRAALGPREHPGRVRGMGFGARPSVVYGRTSDPGSAQSAASGQPSASGPMRSDPEYEARVRARLYQEMREQITDEVYAPLESWVENANNALDRLRERIDPTGPPMRVLGLPPRPTKQPRNRPPGSEPGQPEPGQPEDSPPQS